MACNDEPSGPAVPDDPPPIIGSTEIQSDVHDMAYDPARNVLYLALPDQSEIAVLDLALMELVDFIAVPFGIGGLDMSLGGDSLILVSRTSNELGFVDLESDTRTVEVEQLESAATLTAHPLTGRTLATGELLVTLALNSGSGCGAGSFVLVDLASGDEEILDPGFDCPTEEMRLAVSGDRTNALVQIVSDCCVETVRMYDASDRTFGDEFDVGERDDAPLSVNDDGSVLLVGNRLIAVASTPGAAVDVTVSGDAPTVTALGPQGSDAYFIRGARMHRVEVTYTGVRWVSSPSWSATLPRNVSTVPPEEFRWIKVLPDGRIVVISTERVHLLGEG